MEEVGTVVSGTPAFRAHIIDADYAIEDEGFQIVLYVRKCGSDETVTVFVPYQDYFFIEVGFNVRVHSLQRLVLETCASYQQNVKEKRKQGNRSAAVPPTVDKMKGIDSQPVSAFKVKVFEEVDDHKSLYGYQPKAQKFLKVFCPFPQMTRAIVKGLQSRMPAIRIYEAHISPVNKFLAHNNLSGCAPAEFYGTFRSGENKFSTCDSLFDATKVVRITDNPPLFEPKAMYFDIECLAHDVNKFPTADKCEVIQISYLLSKNLKEVERGVLCYKHTPGSDVFRSFMTEEGMLVRFMEIIRSFNPDVLAGYNSNSFDMPYIITRMKTLGIWKSHCKLSRRKNLVSDFDRYFRESKQMGKVETVRYSFPGRTMFDMMEAIRLNPTIRLRSYSLRNVCNIYLKDGDGKNTMNKEDMEYRDIPVFFRTPEGRSKIASYCMQDTVVLLELDKAMMLTTNAWGTTLALGVTPQENMSRGVVYRVMCKVHRYALRYKFLIPSLQAHQKSDFPKYQGATVLNANAGYYENPVVVLDFGSLYPSLMRGWNLCFTTLVTNKRHVFENPDHFETHDGISFVKSSIHRGIIPLMQEELAAERKAAKAKKAASPKGSIEEAVHDANQAAVKVVMNSAYGMLGSRTAPVPIVEVAKTITFLGRENLREAKEYVEEHYERITGRKGARVIYGDTDSIFIEMPDVSNADSIRFGQMLEKEIQRDLFDERKPMIMEYEKVFCPFVLVTQKRYAGLKMEFDANKAKVSASGLQMVKRDSALICKKTMMAFFDYLLVKKDRKKAEHVIALAMSDLYANRIALEDVVMTKKISRRMEDYENNIPPHVFAWDNLVKRVGPARAPVVGQMFDFIVTMVNQKVKSNVKLRLAIKDLQQVRENGFDKYQIDHEYYRSHALENPLKVILDLVYTEPRRRELLSARNYAQEKVVVASKNNLLGFFGGVEKVVTKKRKLGQTLDEETAKDIRESMAKLALDPDAVEDETREEEDVE
jgi:DNA polymerase delta subunit 1